MQEQRGLIEQPLGRAHALQHDALRLEPQLFLFVGRQLAAGEHHDRRIAQPLVLLDAFHQLEAGDVRQAQVEHDAVERLFLEHGERVGTAADRRDLDVVEADQLGDAHLLGRIVLDHQQLANARRGEFLDAVERRLQPLGGRGLVHEGERAALQAVLALFLDGEDLHRDVTRRGVALQLVEHRPAEHVRQEHVERDRRRAMLAREAQAFHAGLGDDRLELRVAREVEQHLRVVRIVFDDQQHAVLGLQILAIVVELFGACDRHRDRLEHLLRFLAPGLQGILQVGGADVADRQVERERAAGARHARQLQLAAEQVRELAADRQTEAGAAVLARSAGVGLLERFEDDPLLLRRDADAGVRDGELHHRHCLLECRVIRAPAALRQPDVQPHAAVRSELEGVRQQVLENLQQALRVGRDVAADAGVEVRDERQRARLGLVPEVALDRLAQVRELQVLGLDRDRAGLDLRQVENVADQVQQVGARGVNGLRELDLPRAQVAVGVLGQLLAEDQDAVERRAQLVRHVREELGLVARGERQLGRLLFECAPRQLDLLVLALHFRVLLGEQPRLVGELFVGLLQLFLLGLQFAGELLRLLQQALGAHRRFDRVEHDADGARELLEERQVRSGELVHRR